MRKLKQGEPISPVAPLGNNFRPPQPLHQREIRTNIDLYPDRGSKSGGGTADDDETSPTITHCPTMQTKKLYHGK